MSLNRATWPNDCKLGGVTLMASATVTADGTATAVEIGKGKFRVVSTWTACDTTDNDEIYVLTLEANKRSATSTWYEIGTICLEGDSVATGRDTDSAATGAVEVIIDNPYDYQVRVRKYVNGASPAGLTVAVIAYPLAFKN